jgi:TAT-translocated FGD2 family F420-dependent dehydrogenase
MNLPSNSIRSARKNDAFNRRLLLKSAGVLAGAAALNFESSPIAAQSPRVQTINGSLRKGMLGYMLAHEEFVVPELLDIGIAAERAGFDFLAISDHFQPWQANQGHAGMAWVTLGAIGQRTKRVWMGTTVTCPSYRYNPAVVAEGFASLSALNPNRIFLGLGSGEALNEEAATGQWGSWGERSERLIEATALIRELWKGGQVTHKGNHYELKARLYDVPKPAPLILMAANGPKAMQRAGQYGDGLVTDPKTWKQHKSEFEAGARAAGKTAGEMPVLVEQYVVVGDEKEAEQAAELWRFGPKAWNPYYNIPDPAEIQRRAESEIPLKEVYSEWPVSTDPAVHVKKVTELFESGVTLVNIHAGQRDQKRVIEFYGKEVLPRLRNAQQHKQG